MQTGVVHCQYQEHISSIFHVMEELVVENSAGIKNVTPQSLNSLIVDTTESFLSPPPGEQS